MINPSAGSESFFFPLFPFFRRLAAAASQRNFFISFPLATAASRPKFYIFFPLAAAASWLKFFIFSHLRQPQGGPNFWWFVHLQQPQVDLNFSFFSHLRQPGSVASGGFGRLAAAASRKKMKNLILPKFGCNPVARGGTVKAPSPPRAQNSGTPGTKSKFLRNNLKMLCHPICNWLYVAYMNESCHYYDSRMTHSYMSRVPRMNEARFDTYINEACHVHEQVISRLWLTNDSFICEFCYTYKWGMSRHIFKWGMSHVWMSHVTLMTHEWLIHIWVVSYV